MSAQRKHDPLFVVPRYHFDRSKVSASEPLLVIFDSDQCRRCTQFRQQTLANPEVRDLLGAFETVRLDACDAHTPVVKPDGAATTPKAWLEALSFTQLPALAWFNEVGTHLRKRAQRLGYIFVMLSTRC